MKGIIIDIFKFLGETGAWGVVTLSVLIIGVLIYVIFIKTPKEQKKDFQNKNDLQELIKKLALDNRVNHTETQRKISFLEGLVSELKKDFENFEKDQIKDSVEQKTIVKSIDEVIKRVIDITIDLKSLAVKLSEDK